MGVKWLQRLLKANGIGCALIFCMKKVRAEECK